MPGTYGDLDLQKSEDAEPSVKSPTFIEEKTSPPVVDLGEIRLRPSPAR